MKATRPHSSRQRYRRFVGDYRQRRLDALADAADGRAPADVAKAPDAGTAAAPGAPPAAGSTKRRAYVREYLRWLWPYRWAVAAVFALALGAAGLQMVEPLFMRFIIDRVLTNTTLDRAARLRLLNLAGGTFVLVVVLSNLVGLVKDYRQRLLNVRVMLSLRRALFERLLHLPLPKSRAR